MTREQVISLLTQVKKIILGSESWLDSVHQPIEEAFSMAIEALAQPEPKWIPVSERLPEENTPVLLGVKFNDDFKYFVTARMDYNYWQGLGRNIRGEIRWMPLPEPYKED